MKKLIYPLVFTLSAFLILYSCSTEEDNAIPPALVKTPEPEPPAPTQYTLTVSAGEGGTVSTEGGTYDEGTEVTITATPDDGYEFVGWFNEDGGLVSDQISYSFEISFDIELTSSYNLLLEVYVSRAPNYSVINQTSSKYYSQKNGDFYMTRDLHESLSWNEGNIRYMIQERDGVYNDFDSNGSLDFFGFAYWSDGNTGEWGTNPGKYFLIKDFSWGNREKIIYDSSASFSCDMDLANIDSDEDLEILFYTYNVHQNSPNAYNSSLNELPVIIIDIDNNLQISESTFGPEVTSHEGASGDIDNDGDEDIVLPPFNVYYYNYSNRIDSPVVLYNDGNGNFSSVGLLFNSSDSYTNGNSTYSEFFDLNNDGNLDFLTGNHFTYNDNDLSENQIGLFLYWGNGTGKYELDNFTKLQPINNEGYQMVILGSSFLDLDNDGDLDVFTISTRAENGSFVSNGGIIDTETNYYENYILNLFLNENNSFQDVTSTYFDKSKDLSKQNFSHFYDLNLRDVDGDGDFDIIPGGTSGFFIFPQLNNLYWENNGGFFSIREEGGYNTSVYAN